MLEMAWPSLVENLLQTLLGVVDLIFVGQLGPDAIAGVGLGNQLMFLLVVLFMGLAIGNTALVARAIGAKDKPEAERVAKQSLVLTMAFSFVIALIGLFFSDALIRVMGASENVTEIGGSFLRVISVGSVVMGAMFIGSGTLRGAGDTRTPMMITGLVNLINIVLAYLLVFGNFGFPQLGTTGSAVATTLARFVGSLLILYVLFKRNSVLRLQWRGGWGFHRDVIARIVNIGGPAAAENVVFQVGFLAFSAIAISLGTNDLAAQQIAFNIAGFSILPAFAFGVAALTLVGQSLGARDPERAEKTAIEALKTGTAWMVLMGVAFFIWRTPLVAMYTQDPEVQALGEMCMLFIAFAQPWQASSVIVAQALRGAGDTRATLVVTFAGIWVMRVGLGYILGILLGWGLFGMWIAWYADFMVRAILFWVRFRAGKWKTIKV